MDKYEVKVSKTIEANSCSEALKIMFDEIRSDLIEYYTVHSSLIKEDN